jgi:hypothetical protein
VTRRLGRKTLLGPVAGLALLAAGPAGADRVVASERVRSRVVVRASATRDSRDVGSLRPGEVAEYLAATPDWLRVRLDDGTRGFVSRAWTRVIPEEPASPVPVAAGPGGFGLGLLGVVR